MRYSTESKEKINGVVYTPKAMADFLSNEMVMFHSRMTKKEEISILDPAIGDGELVISLIERLQREGFSNIQIVGYETDVESAKNAECRIKGLFDNVGIAIYNEDFLESSRNEHFDFVIANPPYIRTQILGSKRAQDYAQKLGLSGRIDIYYAFIVCIGDCLKADGIAGFITSNKFLTIKSGKSVREYMVKNYLIHEIIDFGDTKQFEAAVLPCITLFSNGVTTDNDKVQFSSIYEVDDTEDCEKINTIYEKIHSNGIFETCEGKKYRFQFGYLKGTDSDNPWVLNSSDTDTWLEEVNRNTWIYFKDMGKIRVGIKTTADNVFIGDDWDDEEQAIELLKPLITHRNAGQIVPKKDTKWKVLYTHFVEGKKKKAVDINKYPCAKKYLERHYEQLSSREYIKKANRNWYEIWVPQDPLAWKERKIVFRDISKQPEFWLDESGAVVNGDCYWIRINSDISENVVYLALAVANSPFIEEYYDKKFNTKLYSGKRRYMTQYVEQFPIPNANLKESEEIIELVSKIISGASNEECTRYKERIDELVNQVFIGH